MNTFRQLILLLWLGLAIALYIVIYPFHTGVESNATAPDFPPVVMTDPAPQIPTYNPSSLATREEPTMVPGNLKFAHLKERVPRTASGWNRADQNLEQLYAVMWQVVEFENAEDSEFQAFTLAILEAHIDFAPGKILAEMIRTAPTTDMRVDTLRLLAEASQELTVTPINQVHDDPDSSARHNTVILFDELSVDELLISVADVVRNGTQRERLAALSTLEEMHRFAPVWEVAYSVMDDFDPQIRMRALELMTYGDRQVATDHLLTALNDPNPDISELAEKLLIGLAEAPS